MFQSLSDHLNINPFCYLVVDDFSYPITKKRTLIGRANECDIILNHPSVAKEQAAILIKGDSMAYLRDLNTTNGTFINKERIGEEEVLVKEGDTIIFAKDPSEYIVNYIKNETLKDTKKKSFNDKVSLVNDDLYQFSKVDHLNNEKFEIEYNNDNENNMKNQIDIKESLDDVDEFYNAKNVINEAENEEDTLRSSGLNHFIANVNNHNTGHFNSRSVSPKSPNSPLQKSSLYQEIYKKNSSLEHQVREKSSELQNISSLYEALTEKYNKLNSTHNTLMIYASDIQKKNDMLTTTLTQYENKISSLTSSPLTNQIKEKNALIAHLQSENEIYKKEINELKVRDDPNIINSYISRIAKYEEIINRYISFETQCTKKWNELLLENSSLKSQVTALKTQYGSEISRYNEQVLNAEKRLSCALAQIPKQFDKFDIKKEEAAKFLVEQMNQVMDENSLLRAENSRLTLRNKDLTIENEKLKAEILSDEMSKKNNDIGALRERCKELEDALRQEKLINSPDKKIDYENIISLNEKDLREKEELITKLRMRIEEITSNNVLIFDDREIVSSLSKVLREKDELIRALKEKIVENNIAMPVGNIGTLPSSNMNQGGRLVSSSNVVMGNKDNNTINQRSNNLQN